MHIRPTIQGDAGAFAAVRLAAGARPRADAFYVASPHIISYVAEDAGEIIGTGAATPYGSGTGWLGLIAVRPDLQRQGVGRELTEWGIAALRGRGARTVLLTATPMGRPLYDALGFRPGSDYIAMTGEGLTAPPADPLIRRAADGDWAALAALDAAATGEQRLSLLHSLPEAYLALRTGEVAGYHVPVPWGGGPTVAADSETGHRLLDLVRGLHGPGPLRIHLPAANTAAVAHLRAAGFAEAARFPLMVLGPWPEPYQPEHIWGAFAFALG